MNLITEYIATVLVEKFDAPADAVSAETTFEDLDFDSLVLIELIVLLERKFGVVLTDGELTADQTIGAAAAVVQARSALV